MLAKSHTGLSPAAKNQLELVSRNGSRLLRLVNTLLDFSRIEAGRMQAIYLPTDLAAFTVELASVFRSATEKAGSAARTRLRDACDEPVYVDRGMWEKIVLNLISNAFKFTFEGEIEVSLGKSRRTTPNCGCAIPAWAFPSRKFRGCSTGFIAWRTRGAARTRAAASAWRWCRNWSGFMADRCAWKARRGRAPNSL